ncbi:MAG: hypothetical protein WBI47_05805, partial [Atribacterales bacterium]
GEKTPSTEEETAFLSARDDGLESLRGESKVRFPQVRHPGDFRAVFSLPLNVSITPVRHP